MVSQLKHIFKLLTIKFKMDNTTGNICNKLALTIVHIFNYLFSKNTKIPFIKNDDDIFKDEEEPIWF